MTTPIPDDDVPTIPSGMPVPPRTDHEILTGHRVTTFIYELTDLAGAIIGATDSIDASDGGSLTWTANQAIKGRGSLSWTRVEDIDWLTTLVRPVVTVRPLDGSGELSWPLGLWVPSIPTLAYGSAATTGGIDLLSREAILSESLILAGYTVAEGANVIDAIRTIIADAGQPASALTDSDATLTSSMTWEAGTSRLQIINDLLDAIGYFSMWTDGAGQFRAEPYIAAGARAMAWEFTDDAERIYTPGWSQTRDLYGVPNTAVSLPEQSGEDAGFVGTAINDDPASPFSTVRRGRQIGLVADTNAAVSQEVADMQAARALAAATNATAVSTIEHALIPLAHNDAVLFASLTAGISARHVVTATTVNLSATKLAQSTIREVLIDG